VLDDASFKAQGVPSPKELAACKAFATKVSELVDQAHRDLLRGAVNGWSGAKIANFLLLLLRDSDAALPHAGNAIEERVYALMRNTNMGLPWVAQFAEAMGAASKPDIVVHLPSGKQALIDVTSDRGHILGKAGGWTTSDHYVYLAEAWFPSVTKPHLPIIKAALGTGGITVEQAQKLREAADDARAKEAAEFLEGQASERARLNQYPSFTAYARAEHGGNKTAASKHLRHWGIRVKGMTNPKGPRKPSEYTKKRQKKKQRELKAKLKKQSVEEILKSATQHRGVAPVAVIDRDDDMDSSGSSDEREELEEDEDDDEGIE
jgi:hypothetical protein